MRVFCTKNSWGDGWCVSIRTEDDYAVSFGATPQEAYHKAYREIRCRRRYGPLADIMKSQVGGQARAERREIAWLVRRNDAL